MTDSRRRIPSVDSLLASGAFGALLEAWPRRLVTGALRWALDEVRDQLAAGTLNVAPDADEIAARTAGRLAEMDRPSLRRVINATGIPLHTNLGRAPLAPEALDAILRVARGYSTLEYDLEGGRRGSRHDHCSGLLRELTGAEDALVVNNNAAALVLVLNEFAEGSEVIVSRGELVEIGGSFRVPEIIAKSGARILEVGATNRTHARDYERAIGEATGLLLKVHRSNFSQSGFVSEVEIGELATIARAAGLPLVHDLGSGLLQARGDGEGMSEEPDVRSSLEAGADIVTFSGDKLLGGPQAGIVVGRGALIERLRSNPLTRALRVGKLTIAALEATLRLWRDPDTGWTAIPAAAMVAADPRSLKQRAERLARAIAARAPGASVEVSEAETEVGGGSYPGGVLRTWIIRVKAAERSEAELEAACRGADPPLIAMVRDEALCLDPRTVAPDEEHELIEAVADALEVDGGGAG